MKPLESFFSRLWEDYLMLNPDARRIEELLTSRGESIVNDHIAFRTFNDPRVSIDVLAQTFLDADYQEGGTYEFEAKQLDARHYEHRDPAYPLIFISELRMGSLPENLQQILNKLLDQIPDGYTSQDDFLMSGRPWEVTAGEYEQLRQASEYAAWMAAFGFRPNHFTILVNSLTSFADIRELTTYLKSEGFLLNESGGEIKGSPEVYLEQASTLANEVEVSFLDGDVRVPSCYYEFAQRYPLADGSLFQGFIAKSADKIFESTDKR